MANSRMFDIVAGPGEAKLRDALCVRDEPRRFIDLTIRMRPVHPHRKFDVRLTVSVTALGHGPVGSWDITGSIYELNKREIPADFEWEVEEIRQRMNLYRARYICVGSGPRGSFVFSDTLLIPVTFLID